MIYADYWLLLFNVLRLKKQVSHSPYLHLPSYCPAVKEPLFLSVSVSFLL